MKPTTIKINNKKYEVTSIEKSEKVHRDYTITTYHGRPLGSNQNNKLILTIEEGEY